MQNKKFVDKTSFKLKKINNVIEKIYLSQK